MTQYALQLRPTQYLKDALDGRPTPWILAANQPANGLNIPITGWIEAADLPEEAIADVARSLSGIASTIRAASASVQWNVSSDARARAVSLPQRGVQPTTLNSWFVSLLGRQGSLGQIAAQLYCYPSLAPFRPALFPTYQKTPYGAFTDNLGAWSLELAKSAGSSPYTRQEALAIRSRIVEEIDSWCLVLVRRSGPGDPPQVPVIWPDQSALEAGRGILYSPLPSLLPPSIYPTPLYWY
jgi:hypothetical protein